MIPLRRFRSPAVISLSFCLMAGPGAAVELDPVPHRVNAAIPKTESGPVEGAVVDNSGAVTLSIPIDTPVGSGGFEPELALQYSSQSGDGYAGIGWRLNLSEIRRTTRFGVYGAHATPPNALYYEPFELDGELLVAVGGGEYRTRQESFARITNSGTTWEVVYPNGTKARYGTRPNTVINNIVYGSASRWLLSELEDANGNTIYFDYERKTNIEPEGATPYPKEVTYSYRGGQPMAPLRKIEFFYDDARPDPAYSYSLNIQLQMKRRLIEIRSSVPGEPYLHRLVITYSTPGSYTTHRSRIASVQRFGCAGDLEQCTAMPPQTFTYVDPADQINLANASSHWQKQSTGGFVSSLPALEHGQGYSAGIDDGIRFGDVNGDGLVDYVRAFRTNNPGSVHEVHLNTGGDWEFSPEWTTALANLSGVPVKRLHFKLIGGTWCYDGTVEQIGRVYFAYESDFGVPEESTSADRYYVARRYEDLIDINGDGRVDIVGSYVVGGQALQCGGGGGINLTPQAGAYVYLNTGEGWSWSQPYSDTFPRPIGVFKVGYSESGAAAKRNEDRCIGAQNPDGSCDGNGYVRYIENFGYGYADLNGDGLPDMIRSAHSPTYFNGEVSGEPGSQGPVQGGEPAARTAWINRGLDFFPSNDFAPPQSAYLTVEYVIGTNREITSDFGLRIADVNADGFDDLVKSAGDPIYGGGWVLLGSGYGWSGVSFSARYLPPIPFTRIFQGSGESVVVSNQLSFVDLNGDGLPDLLRTDGSDSTNGLKAWIHDPSAPSTGSVWVEKNAFKPTADSASVVLYTGGEGAKIIPRGVRLLDIDGNGTTDIVRSHYHEPSEKAIFYSRTNLVDRLRKHENGQGGSESFAYASAILQRSTSNEALAAADEAAFSESELPLVPPFYQPWWESLPPAGLELWGPTPVVTKQTVQGLDTAPVGFVSTFTYSHPKYDPFDRTGLGFRLVEVERPDGSLERTYYRQKSGLGGRPSRIEIWDGPQVASLTTQNWALVGGGSVGGSTSLARVARLTSETSQQRYTVGFFGAFETASYEYDDAYGYNFVETRTISRPTGTSVERRTPYTGSLPSTVKGLVGDEGVEDPAGTVLRHAVYTYQAATGLPASVTRDDCPVGEDPCEATITEAWDYDACGNLTSETNASGRTWEFAYDCAEEGSGALLTTVTDPLEGTTSVPLSDAGTGHPIEITLWNGDEIRFEYDRFGRQTLRALTPAPRGSTTYPESVLEEWNYKDSAPRPFVEHFRYTDAATAIREAVYTDGLGQAAIRVREASPAGTSYLGRFTKRDYAGRGILETYDLDCGTNSACSALPAQADPPSGTAPPRTLMAYDALGRVESTVTPDGTSTAIYTGQAGPAPFGAGSGPFDAALLTDARGNQTRRITDGDRLVWVEECDGSCGSSEKRTVYSYLATGELARINDRSGLDTPAHRITYSLDTLGRPRAIDDPAAGHREMTYTGTGKVATVKNARLQVTTYLYDALDRLDEVDRSDAPLVKYTYADAFSRQPSAVAEQGLGANYQATYTYDEFDRVQRKIVSIPQGVFVTDYRHDLLGRLRKLTPPVNGAQVVYDYEGLYLTRACTPISSTDTDCSGTVQQYISDVIYDELGRPDQVATPPAVLDHEYFEETHRLEQLRFSNAPSKFDLRYTYDAVGNVASITDDHTTDAHDASATYGYDGRDRIQSIQWGSASMQTFGYDLNGLGNLTEHPTGAGIQTQHYEDAAHPTQLTRIVHPTSGESTFEYDEDGNQNKRIASTGGTQWRRYDSSNRLECIGTSLNACDLGEFEYDPEGNLIRQTSGGETRVVLGSSFEWISAGTTQAAVVYVEAFGRRVTSRSRNNPVLRQAGSDWSLPWAPDPRTIGGVLGGLGVLGLLIALARLGAADAWLARPIRVSGTWVLIVVLVLPPTRAAAVPPGQPGDALRWIFADHLGSGVLITQQNGTVVHRRVFEPYGEIHAETLQPTETTPRLFTDQRYVAGVALYDFDARWYDADTGRFLQRDPVVGDTGDPQTHNGYSYVENRPLNRTDPTGMASRVGRNTGITFGFESGSLFGSRGTGSPAGGPYGGRVPSPPTSVDPLASGVQPIHRFMAWLVASSTDPGCLRGVRRNFLARYAAQEGFRARRGETTDLVAFARVANAAAAFGTSPREFFNDLGAIFSGTSVGAPQPLGRDPRVQNYRDRGYAGRYRDGGNQVRHMVGAMILGATLGPRLGRLGNEYRERLFGGSEITADIALGNRAAVLGANVMRGATPTSSLGSLALGIFGR